MGLNWTQKSLFDLWASKAQNCILVPYKQLQYGMIVCFYTFTCMLKRIFILKRFVFEQLKKTDTFFFVVCPWGNYFNIRKSDLDSLCEKKINGNCNKYCINPAPGSDLKDGQNCCKACIDLCQKSPARDSNFKAEYPEIYS